MSCAFAGCPSPGVWKNGRGRNAFALCESHIDALRDALQRPLMRFRLDPDYDNADLWNVWDCQRETFVAYGLGQHDAWAIAVLLERSTKASPESDATPTYAVDPTIAVASHENMP